MEKIGGLWWDGDQLVADPSIAQFAERFKSDHEFREKIFDEAIKHNALLRSLVKDKPAVS